MIKNSQIAYDFQFINAANNQIYEISNSIEFVVTKIDDKNVEKFKALKSVWRNVSLSKQLGTYDPEFWENYNVIKGIEIE